MVKAALAAGHNVVAFGRDTDQRNKMRLDIKHERLSLIHGDLRQSMSQACERIDAIIHLAAATFVDHSIRDPQPFIDNNVLGMYSLLEGARRNGVKKILIQSTDEVYGAILSGQYTEDSRLNPTNPYAASKAAADMLARAYHNTYGMEIVIARLENVYGPYQHPQKVLPTFTRKAMANEPLPVYGDGKHRRQWLHVDDNVSALLFLLDNWHPGEIYHVAGHQELENLDLAKRILGILDKLENKIMFLDDHNARPGHDRRYALDSTKIRSLGWKPEYTIDTGLPLVVNWYRDNPWWFS